MGKRDPVVRGSRSRLVLLGVECGLLNGHQESEPPEQRRVISRRGRVVSFLCLMVSLVFLVLLMIPPVGSLIVHKRDGEETYGPYRGAALSLSHYFDNHSSERVGPGYTFVLADYPRSGLEVWDGSSQLIKTYPDFGSELKYDSQGLADLVIDYKSKLLYVINSFGPVVGIYTSSSPLDAPVFDSSYRLPTECGRNPTSMYLSPDKTSLTVVNSPFLEGESIAGGPYQSGDVFGCRINAATGALDSVIKWSDPSAAVVLATRYDSQSGDLFFLSSTNSQYLTSNHLQSENPGQSFLSVLRSGSTTIDNYPAPPDSLDQCPCKGGTNSLVIQDTSVYAILGAGIYQYSATDSSTAPVKVWQEKDKEWRPIALVAGTRPGENSWWIGENNGYMDRFAYYSDDFARLIHPIEFHTDAKTFFALDDGLIIGGLYNSDTVIDLAVSPPFDALWNWTYFWLWLSLAFVGSLVLCRTILYERLTTVSLRNNREAIERCRRNNGRDRPALKPPGQDSQPSQPNSD